MSSRPNNLTLHDHAALLAESGGVGRNVDRAALAEDEVSAGTSAGRGSTSNCPACGATNRRPGGYPEATEAEITSRFQRDLAACRGVAGSQRGVRGHFAGQSGLRHHAACQRGTVFKTRANPPKSPWLRHHAACQRGAVFTANDGVIGTRSGREHGPTLASSVVAGVREVISATVATNKGCAPDCGESWPSPHALDNPPGLAGPPKTCHSVDFPSIAGRPG